MTSLWKRLGLLFGIVVASLALTAAPASAQATRTWVSGVGDDANPCSRTAPCKTFAGAISKTAAGGEINCLDPGGWGSVTITKALTIDCSQFPGSILNAGTPGITVNAAASDDVVIRGLEISGGTGGSAGTSGIRFLAGRSLTLENVIIRNQTNGNGVGISFTPGTNAFLALTDVTIVTSGSGTGAGVYFQPTGSGSATAVISHTRIVGGSAAGIRADATGLTGGSGVTLQLVDSVVSGNSSGIFLFAPGGSTTPLKAMIVNSTISNNTSTALLANGTTITALVSGSTITNNGQGVIAAGATVLSYQDNRLFGNATNNTFPATLPKN